MSNSNYSDIPLVDDIYFDPVPEEDIEDPIVNDIDPDVNNWSPICDTLYKSKYYVEDSL